MSKPKQTFRDITAILQSLRNFMLGRKYINHARFVPFVSSRTIPPADIPRGTDLKYSEQYYFKRHAFDSVKPPVVAPIAGGAKGYYGNKAKGNACKKIPTPGSPWWWDGHCYYVCTPDAPTCKTPTEQKKST